MFLGQVLRGFPCGMTLRRLHHILQTEGVLQDLPRHWDSLEFVYLLFHVPGIKLWVPNNGTEVVAYRAVPGKWEEGRAGVVPGLCRQRHFSQCVGLALDHPVTPLVEPGETEA